jgi:VIT1/CCC1 family predicted Fe2+/Mn2+ transporter
MDKWKAAFQTSEGWATLVAAILGAFVALGLMTPELSKVVQDIITALLAVAFARIAKKAATPGETPFQPAAKAAR